MQTETTYNINIRSSPKPAYNIDIQSNPEPAYNIRIKIISVATDH